MGALLLALAGCGGSRIAPAISTAPAAAPPPHAEPANADLAPTGLPGMGPYSLLILAGPESMELEVMGAAYACTALGWRTTIVAPSLGGLHGRHGLPIPGDIALGRLVPDAYTALIVPGGAPRDAEALALIARFAREADTRLLAPTTAGLESVRAVPELASLAAASKDEGIHLDGNRLTAARTGDLPALCHALDAVAKDRWPR